MGSERDAIFHDLIDDIYAAALTPDKWRGTLTSIAHAFDGLVTTFVPLNDPAATMASPGMEAGEKAYADYWWAKDSITQAGQRRGLRKGLVCDWTMITPAEARFDPFYQEFRRDVGIGHCVGFLGETRPTDIFAFVVHLPFGKAPPSPDTVRDFQVIARHVNRAVEIMARTSSVAGAQHLDAVLSKLQCAAAIVDEAGQVVLANAALQTYARDGLDIIQGKLTTARAAEQADLDALIRDVTQTRTVRREPGILLVTRPSGRRPYLVRSMPLTASQFRAYGAAYQRTSALVMAVDLENDRLLRPQQALQRLGLTPAEAQVAAMVGSGRSPRETAVLQGVLEGTVRNQLKTVFAKLAIARQAELSLMIAKLSVL